MLSSPLDDHALAPLFEDVVIADLSNVPAQNGFAGRNIELSPGSYILRLEHPGYVPLEMTVVTCAGWQTRVILPLEVVFPELSTRLPSFEKTTVLMAPLGQSFRPGDQTTDWVRMACRWLARGEPVAPVSELRQAVSDANEIRRHIENENSFRDALRDKFTNPCWEFMHLTF